MPKVEPTEITTEASQQQLDNQASLHANVLDKIKGGNVFKSLTSDLPSREQPQEEEPVVEEQQVEEQKQEEQAQEEQTQEETQDDGEEVVAKSKIQPRIDQLTARLKAQQAEIDSLKNQTSSPKDEIQSQLDAMSEDALEDSLTQVRVAKEKARDDEAKLLELVKLERRIEKTIVQAPQRFAQNQVKEFNNTVQRLSNEGELTNDNYAAVLKIAKEEIYDKYPKLAKSVDGQAMALELAVAHFKQLNRSSSNTSTVKAETQNLKGQINNLKKKTALDTKNIKGGSQNVTLDKLRSNAMNGSMRDKERFAHNDPRFKIDAMIPDYMKG